MQPEQLGSYNGQSYYRTPKSDGGYDYYRDNGQATFSMSGQDVYDALSTSGTNPMWSPDQRSDNGPWNPTPQNLNVADTSTTTAPAAPANTDADTAAYYQDQIDQINRLLGVSSAGLAKGLTNVDSEYAARGTDLANQKTRAMQGYEAQDIQNAADKQGGISQVDTFANTSLRSLMRLLGGAGAGNSSVARTVVPTLVSKAGDTRRREVFNTSGENQMNIDNARIDAGDQFTNRGTALNDWQRNTKNKLETDAAQIALDRTQQLQTLGINKAQAAGTGYEAAKAEAGATTADVNQRMNTLNNLFANFTPTYTPQAINLVKPDLAKYQLDKGSINVGGVGSGSSYYGNMLKKRKELAY